MTRYTLTVGHSYVSCWAIWYWRSCGGMKYLEVVTLFVFVMLVVSLFYGNSIWSFRLSIFAMALFMQNNCWNGVNVSFSLCSLQCAVSMFCNCIRIFVIMVSCGSWVLSYFKLFLDVHILCMVILLVWLLVYFWSLSCLRLVWESVVVVCIVVVLVCCRRVGGLEVCPYFFLFYCIRWSVGFYSIVAYLVSHFCIAGELLCGVGNAAVGPTFAPGYRITVNYCLLVDLLFTI